MGNRMLSTSFVCSVQTRGVPNYNPKITLPNSGEIRQDQNPDPAGYSPVTLVQDQVKIKHHSRIKPDHSEIKHPIYPW